MKYVKFTKELEEILDTAVIFNGDKKAYLCFSGKIKEEVWYKRWFHYILKWLDRSWMTHVSILFYDKNDEWLCMESTYPVTQINDFKWFKEPYHQGEIYKLTEISQEKHIEIIKKLSEKYLGSKYGIWQLFGAFLVRIGITLFNIFDKSDKIQVCSELLYYYLMETCYAPLLKGLKPNVVSPKQIKEKLKPLLEENPRKMVLIKSIGFKK